MRQKERFMKFILERFQIERKKFDRSGVYAYTQRILAYNSNKIDVGYTGRTPDTGAD